MKRGIQEHPFHNVTIAWQKEGPVIYNMTGPYLFRVDTHGLAPRGTQMLTQAGSVLWLPVLDALRTARSPPHSIHQSKRRSRETTTPPPLRSASARVTGAEVADLHSLSSCPQNSNPHRSEEAPVRQVCDQLAHAIVGPPHRGDSAGPAISTLAQPS